MKIIFIIYIILFSISFSSPLDSEDIEMFFLFRYGGDTMNVNSYLSENFIYEHTPYVGLGIQTNYIDESLLITGLVDDSIQTLLDVGDRIFEYNNQIVDSVGINTTGYIGKSQKLIVIKRGDSSFVEINTELKEYQYLENINSFLASISSYSDKWYEYDITFKDIVLKKNKIAIHYTWEGSKHPKDKIYKFSAMEILYVNKKSKLIEKIVGVWSEKQFRDQFK